MTEFAHSLAVVIGIDDYANGIPRLTTAVNDATRLAELLRTTHGYETLLLTEPTTGQSITRARLAALFTQELPGRLGDDDRLLVYFAGHGVALDGDDGPRGYLVPQDAQPGDSASMLAMTDLHAWLTALSCRHMLAVLDCCFAGAFRWSATRHMGVLPEVIHKERYDRYLLSPAWQVLTSAAYDQKALDVLAGDAKRGTRAGSDGLHSPFALALFDALERGDADLIPKGQGDGVITATELYLYLRERVEVQAETRASHEQTPGLWPLNKHRKGEFIFLAPGHPLNLPPAPDLTAELNPYRGLKSYDQQHSPLFFGREDEIKALTALVDEKPFVAVLGASGTGKSSLVKAGVLTRLAEVRGQGSGDKSHETGRRNQEEAGLYRVLPPIRPTDQPVRALAKLLHAELSEDLGGLIAPPSLELAEIVARWAEAHPGQQLVLTIDQFEELATLCRDDTERERFLRLLAAAVREPSNAFRLIITLRTDFEPQFTQADSPLADAWQAARYVVPPLDREDLRQVIEGPAAARVLYFDPPKLVDDLIEEVNQTPGALPLLSFTLSELYVKYMRSGRDDRALSEADYKALGGVVGSLRNRATEEYEQLPNDAHRATMQRVMLRMVAVEGGELARRRVALSELEYPTAEENARVQAVLDRLVDARLLVRGTSDPSTGLGQGPDGAKGEAYVEPAHDALVLAWDRLLRWKKEAEEYLPLQRRLAQAVAEWHKANPEAKSGFLWDNDPRLPQLEETLWPTGERRSGPAHRLAWGRQVLWPRTEVPTSTRWLNRAEIDFGRASVAERAKFWRRLVGTTLGVLVALIALTSFALVQQGRATSEADRATRAQGTAVAEVVVRSTAEADAVQANKTAIAEGNARATEVVVRATAQANAEREARRAKVGELAARSKSSLAVDPELSILLASSALSLAEPEYALEAEEALREALQVSRVETRIPFNTTGLTVGTISSDGSRFATADRLGRIQVRSTLTGEQLQKLDLNVDTEVCGLKFVPQNPVRLTLILKDAVQLWDLDAMKQVFVAQLAHAYPCDFVSPFVDISSDGRLLVTRILLDAVQSTVQLWDIGTGQAIAQRTFSSHGPLRFSVDGRLLAVAVQPGKISLWDGNLQTEVNRWDVTEGTNAEIYAMTISGNQEMAVGDSNGIIRAWDISKVDAPRLLYSQQGHSDYLFMMAFSSTGECLVTTSNDQTTFLWDRRGNRLMTLAGHKGQVNSAAFLQSSEESEIQPKCGTRHVATLSRDDTVRTWNIDDSHQFRGRKAHPAPIEEIEFSPDGSHLVTVGDDRKAMLWRTATLDLVDEITHTQQVEDVDFSPDGGYVATAVRDGTAALWDQSARHDAETLLKGGQMPVYAATFSPPEGRHLATGGADGSVILWDVSQKGAPLELRKWGLSQQGVYSVEFSKDGKRLATGSFDGLSHIVDIESGKVITVNLGSDYPVYHAVIHPEKPYLATASDDGKVRLWTIIAGKDNYQVGQDDQVIAQHKSAVSTLDFNSTGNLLASGGHDGKIILWDLIDRTLKAEWQASTKAINSVRFSPDDQLLAMGDDRGSVEFFLVDSRALVEYAKRARVTRTFTAEECQDYDIGSKCLEEAQ